MLTLRPKVDPGSEETLARASEANNIDQLRAVLARGVDVDATNAFGTTALMTAASRGHLQIVRLLVSCGANPNRVRHDKFTALALAAFFGHEDVVKFLVENGADPNASTRFDTSPQMWASARTFRGVARYLGNGPTEEPPIQTKENPRARQIGFETTTLHASYHKEVSNDLTQETESTGLQGEMCQAEDLQLPLALSKWSFPVPFSLHMVMSTSVLLLIAATFLGYLLSRTPHTQPATNQTPQSTLDAARTAVVEKSLAEPPKVQIDTLGEASINLNHSDATKAQPINSTPKRQNRIQRLHGDEVSIDSAPATVSEEQKITTQATSRSSLTTPKPTLERPVSGTSKPSSMTTQLLSSPEGTQTKRKVIQWP